MPEYREGDTRESMNRKCEEMIAGVNHNNGMITLGGYGGYVVVGFDHEVQNVQGQCDIRILGNAFYADANPNPYGSKEGGSAEPGIVMVSRDDNGNGLPDDQWYEIKGSAHDLPNTVKNYTITYNKPDENKAKQPHPTDNNLNDVTYIQWTATGESGYLYKNTAHSQPYYPLWIDADQLTFTGTKLPNNAIDESGIGRYYVLYAYRWGYADNQPNNINRAAINIDWAVDQYGNKANLNGIHFVKVYNALNQNCGWLGETSTEIAGAVDLHLTNQTVYDDFSHVADIYNPNVNPNPTPTPTPNPVDPTPVDPINPDPSNPIDPSNPTPDPTPVLPSLGNVELNYTTLTMKPYGEVVQLVCTQEGWEEGNVNQYVKWRSTDENIVAVTERGLLCTGNNTGEAIITVMAQNGKTIAQCIVNVTNQTHITGDQDNQYVYDKPGAYAHDNYITLVNMEKYMCKIYNMNGTLVHIGKPSRQLQYIYVKNKGTYLVVAYDGFTQLVLKIVL
jgi:hypothetical protein